MDLKPFTHHVSHASAREFEQNLDSLVSSVDKRMTVKLEEENLIGHNPLSVMYDNHENHGNLMVNIFFFNDYALLANIFPWVISSYTARGFSRNYFPEVLDQWKKAAAQHLSSEASEEILPVYEWMEEALPVIEEGIESGTLVIKDINEAMQQSQVGEVKHFSDLLLRGKHNEAHQFVKQRISSSDDLRTVYDALIRPAMYEVGRLWENNTITVAHEHLATSIIMRIITYFYMDYVSSEVTKGKAVVTAAANEYHEIGARIIADFLEMDGWDVTYLGANMPAEELLLMLGEEHPDILCISVTMAFNFTKVIRLIEMIRERSSLRHIKIMAGGHAFTYSGGMAEKIGADAVALSAGACLSIAESWWNEAAHV